MIDPSKITDYNLTEPELQEMVLWWVCAAGKNGTTAARCHDTFLKYIGVNKLNPAFKVIQKLPKEKLPSILKSCGIGCHSIKARTMWELAHSNLNLKKCEAVDLEKIYGIGMKTSRCFIIHTRKNARYAGLDTHMLKFLRKKGHDAPKATPTGKKYLELEKLVIEYADKAKKTPAEFDLDIWNKYKIKSTPGGAKNGSWDGERTARS